MVVNNPHKRIQRVVFFFLGCTAETGRSCLYQSSLFSTSPGRVGAVKGFSLFRAAPFSGCVGHFEYSVEK